MTNKLAKFVLANFDKKLLFPRAGNFRVETADVTYELPGLGGGGQGWGSSVGLHAIGECLHEAHTKEFQSLAGSIPISSYASCETLNCFSLDFCSLLKKFRQAVNQSWDWRQKHCPVVSSRQVLKTGKKNDENANVVCRAEENNVKRAWLHLLNR